MWEYCGSKSSGYYLRKYQEGSMYLAKMIPMAYSQVPSGRRLKLSE
jgi:hypothetical protein